MRLLAPAKINLHLRVGLPNADGYHPLLSWMATVGLFDTLQLQRTTRDISLTCDDPSLACDQTNLIHRAACAILSTLGQSEASAPRQSVAPPRVSHSSSGIAIHLEKRIPAGGGLGGGSSDAARTLIGLNRFLRLDRSTEELADIACSLGSDVAFFLHGPSSICTGRGEVVRPIARPTPRFVVLILPGIVMATPLVYKTFDEMRLGDSRAFRREPNWSHWATLSSEKLLPLLENDLEAAAFAIQPELGRFRLELEARLKRPVRMSGSGSSLFTLYDDQPRAEDAARSIFAAFKVHAIAVELAPQVPDDLYAAPT